MNVYRQIETPAISTDEIAQRRRSVDFARGSVRLEGFTLSPEVETINRRYESGELTSDEHVEAIKALYA
jgi:hypothetical protein